MQRSPLLRATDARRRSAIALAAASAALAFTPSLAQADTITQAEGFTLSPAGTGQSFSDSAADGGKTLKIWSNASASGTINTESDTVNLRLRARGQQCNGAPVLTVDVDGTRRYSATISSTVYAAYSTDLTLSAGTHTVKVNFANDFRTSSCDRNAFLDKITLVSSSTPTDPKTGPITTPTPTPTPPPIITPTPTPTPVVTPTPTPTPGPVTGSVKFNGDFESGDLSQWSGVQRVAADRLTTVESLARQGRYAGRVEIRGGDPLLYTGQRSELLWGQDSNLTLKSGDDYYFGWSTYFAKDFPSPTNGGHCLFIQWKNGGTGSPPLDLECKSEKISITYGGKCGGWNTPLVRGGWNDFVARIKFNASSSVGFIELWHKAPNESAMTKKVDHCNTSTLNAGSNSYLKQGYYRRYDEQRTGVLFHDGMKVGSSFTAVAPR
jgi:hypothetical protein